MIYSSAPHFVFCDPNSLLKRKVNIMPSSPEVRDDDTGGFSAGAKSLDTRQGVAWAPAGRLPSHDNGDVAWQRCFGSAAEDERVANSSIELQVTVQWQGQSQSWLGGR